MIGSYHMGSGKRKEKTKFITKVKVLLTTEPYSRPELLLLVEVQIV